MCAQKENDSCTVSKGRFCDGLAEALFCDAATMKCKKTLQTCSQPSDCPNGLTCFNDSVKGCAVSCADDSGNPLDIFCQLGKTCNATTYLCTP